MFCETLPGLSMREAERNAPMGQPRLLHMHHNFGSGDSLAIRLNHRLPPISNLLKDMPLPPSPPQPHTSVFPSTLPAPISCSPSFFSNAYPDRSTLPPRPRSVPQQHRGGLLPPPRSTDPRRASIQCIGADFNTANRPYSVPERNPFHHHHRASPDICRDRQRRNSKHQARLRRGSTPSSNPSDRDNYHIVTPNTSPPRRHKPSATRQRAPPPTPSRGPHLVSPPPLKPKRNNQPFTFEQEAFIIYHRVELALPWAEVRRAYMARWPALRRSVSGLQCAYYRTNLELPVVTADGLLVLIDPESDPDLDLASSQNPAGEAAPVSNTFCPTTEPTPPGSPELVSSSPSSCYSISSSSTFGVMQAATASEGEEGGSTVLDNAVRPREWYKFYRGVAYRTRRVKCRSARISLTERFPEELLDEKNDWVREEHRAAARDVGEYKHFYRTDSHPLESFDVFFLSIRVLF
ncbi:hypothetical protein C7999DRAFT_14242 [Corynascus novoguineensis]|uniref:Uncharacterized protein n=1 Tax=Corynascus novoguineensis TaxID=1126955 RepID=A0AAN7HP06_9PEZI|nr:hypothetical protein C7999DRAFT_14242 [Corynascus novoguineensis]